MINPGALIIRNGKVVEVNNNGAVPEGATVIDCRGKTIYPSFIDLYAEGFGLPPGAAAGASPEQKPQQFSNKKGAYAWNEALRPEFNAADAYSYDAKAADEYRKIGFGALVSFRPDGISRGAGALVLPAEGREHQQMLSLRSAHFLSFRKGSSTQDYPSSLMGCIALIRQTYLDGQWYRQAGLTLEKNISLEAWNNLQTLPQIFEASEKQDIARIRDIGKEFGMTYIVKTAGDEYQNIDLIKAAGMGLIVPLRFPDAFNVQDPFVALDVPLQALKHWEMAPYNPARIAAAGIPFSLTTSGLKEKSKFLESLRKAVACGLPEETALKALTWQPAQMLGMYQSSERQPGIGSLEPGKIANLIIVEGNIFQPDGKVLQNWVNGKPYVYNDPSDQAREDIFREYRLALGDNIEYPVFLNSAQDAYLLLERDSTRKTKINFSVDNGLYTFLFAADSTGKKLVRLSGTLRGAEFYGRGQDVDGRWFDWSMRPQGEVFKFDKKTPPVSPKAPVGEVIYPFTAFGNTQLPQSNTFLIRNSTVWTSAEAGILQNTDVLISGGKIRKIGKQLAAPAGAIIIDGTKRHLTAGIIDEHSHIAISRSVNEGTQESSAEVRIGDVLDAEDINIYRQLAGGVTSSHLLHGSANPIGGQTQLIKLRWGYPAEQLKFAGWPGYIKFALGENVKQSNWGDQYRSRFPQTRMGVEQTFVDYFTRAREYGQVIKSGKPYRRDLDLEALLEIMEGKRFITCHSYVQSEITMLMRVAERFGFRVNTFTHILEGYKVADKMAKHGAGGSTFSDWWAYKYEVVEAIPQNAQLMMNQGVTVCINSDDAEMARRLNQEAAKSVLYAGMKPEDAWNMVTINPAKLLRVDERVGSIQEGKDADIVLWNADPLSIYARAEKTWVDGILFFDREKEPEIRARVQAERNRLIQLMLASAKGNEPIQSAPRTKKQYHCDSDADEGN